MEGILLGQVWSVFLDYFFGYILYTAGLTKLDCEWLWIRPTAMPIRPLQICPQPCGRFAPNP
jgi:hypothetical protein